MNLEKKDLLFFILFLILFYKVFFVSENMAFIRTHPTEIEDAVKNFYKADVNAIRNLSSLATDLTKNGKLVIKGGLEIDGALTVKGKANLQNTLDVTGVASLKNNLNVTGAASLNTLNVTGAASLENTLNVTGKTTLEKSLRVNSSLNVNNKIYINGNAAFGNIYFKDKHYNDITNMEGPNLYISDKSSGFMGSDISKTIMYKYGNADGYGIVNY